MAYFLVCVAFFSYYLGLSKSVFAVLGLISSAVFLFSNSKVLECKFLSSSLLKKSASQVLFFLLLLYPAFVLAVQLARLSIGAQGIDFAIFSQVVESFSQRGEFASSLIGYKWYHFLTHHFSPYLYLLGYLNIVFDKAEILLIVFHALTVFILGFFSFSIFKELGFKRERAILLLGFFALLPSVRIALLWEVRDEIYALPYILAAYLFFLRGQTGRVILALFVTLFFKETMFLQSASFCLMAIIWQKIVSRDLEKRALISYALFSVFCLLGFFLYTKILPRTLFWPTFDGYTRISSFEEFFDAERVFAKMRWLAVLLFPCLPLVCSAFLKLRREGKLGAFFLRFFLLLFPAGIFLSAIAISNFEMMYHPLNYYAVLPVVLFSLALVIALKKSGAEISARAIVCSCFLACVVGNNKQARRDVFQALSKPSPVLALRGLIPESAVVIAGDYDASFFIRQSRLVRIAHANKNILRFDYIVQRKTAPSYSIGAELSLYLRSWSKVCYEDEDWLVRCAYPSVRAAKIFYTVYKK